MTDDFKDVPVMSLPGSEAWESAYRWGEALDERFPGQDADQFGYACVYNGFGPAGENGITGFVMAEQGDNDGPDWRWVVEFDNGETWVAEGGCDFTGWDCQSDLRWRQVAG